MSSIQTKSSVLALKKETTEGTPVLPTAATDYVALQDGFTASPEFNLLDNAELKASIGKAKGILGLESPKMSFSHYLRSSAVVAQAPDYGLLLEALFGAVTIASTEYDTVASSTTVVIKVNTGEGSTFQRGEPLLIKDGVNGYRIRAIESISGDNLTLMFQVPTAPGTGVNLGKAVLYYPANSGHPTITAWHYLGNGGAIQMMAGARVTNLAISIAAGELINGSYDLEGIAFYFDPINITSTDIYLDFTDDDGTWAAVVSAKVYKDPHELADAIQSAMATANPLQTPTVIYSNSTGKFTIKTTGTLLSLLWNTGTNTANTIGDKIGFSTASDSTGTGATTGYTSANAQVYSSPQTPTFDTSDPLVAKDNEVMIGDVTDYVCFAASKADVTIADTKADILSICAVSGKSGSLITAREVKVAVSALIQQYDADKWRRFRANSNTKFQYSGGVKSGGNWVAGKNFCIAIPTATITSWTITDNNGQAQLDFEVTGYVDDQGDGEVFIGFV
jgi:hypothetical protein